MTSRGVWPLVAGALVLAVVVALAVTSLAARSGPRPPAGNSQQVAVPHPAPSATATPVRQGPPGGRRVACPTSGAGVVALRPSDDVAARIRAAPAGTTFHLRGGHYVRITIHAKARDRFCGDGIGRTVFDARGACIAGITSDDDPAVDDVVIDGVTLQNYCPRPPHGWIQPDSPIYAGGYASLQTRSQGWQIIAVESRSSSIGAVLGNRSYVAGSIFFHNYYNGINGGGVKSLIEYNTFDQNDWQHRANAIDGFSSGTKTALSDHVIFRHNIVENTSGPGIWFDTENSHCEVADNLIQHLGDSGAFIEVSYGCSVHDNVIRDVGLQDKVNNFVGDGIEISTSGPVQVYGNYVIDAHGGIVIHQENRGADPTLGNYHGPFCANGGSVRDNYVLMRAFTDEFTGEQISPQSGWVNGQTPTGCRGSASLNTWDGNRYYLDDTGRKAWLIDGRSVGWSAWQADGRDRRGRVLPATQFPALPALSVGYQAYRS